jgi:hypothetical protein
MKKSTTFGRLPAAMGVTQIKEWFNHFKDGRMLVDSDQHSGRLSTSRNVIDKVLILIMEDCRLTIREIADEDQLHMYYTQKSERRNDFF